MKVIANITDNRWRVNDIAGPPLVSAIVAMRNEEQFIGQCLRSLADQDYPAQRLEILVVDGGSTDRSQEIVQDMAATVPNLRLLDNEKKVAPAGFNIGIRNARGDIVTIISAHCYLAEDYVSRCVEYLDKTGADCVGGPIESIGETRTAKAIALVFERSGVFDEELVGSEDDEFNYRLRRHGGKLFLAPVIRSFYHSRATLPALWRQYFNYGSGKVRVVRKHPGLVRLRHLIPALFVLTLIVTGLLALFIPPFALLFALVVGSYAVLSISFSLRIARRKGWQYMPILPPAFACLHVAYGIGFLNGVLHFLLLGSQREDQEA
jgi:succinoglycan biosynthesis protein ExoA